MIWHWLFAAFAGWHAAREDWLVALIAIIAIAALQIWQWRKLAEQLAEDITHIGTGQ